MDLAQYAQELQNFGWKAIPGTERSLWVSHSRFAMQRHPVFALHEPTRKELHQIFRKSWVSVLNFAVRPSEQHNSNGYLYLCESRKYSIEGLGHGARSQVRRGLREFDFRFIEHSEFLSKGAQAYCDTIKRNGFAVITPEDFVTGYSSPPPGRKYIGAFKDSRLAAFMMVTEVDDWVAIEGYSADEFLPLCPNNGLIYFTVHHYLSTEQFRAVTLGLSSLQTASQSEGLHRFKVNMGFAAIPVYRALVVNPLLRPLVNQASWALLKAMLKLSRNHPLLRKAEGAVRMVLS